MTKLVQIEVLGASIDGKDLCPGCVAQRYGMEWDTWLDEGINLKNLITENTKETFANDCDHAPIYFFCDECGEEF